ncbi:DNA-binding protein [Metarhizium brunneum]
MYAPPRPSFIQRVKLGLKRDNPFLITPEVEESARNVPPIFAEKILEWAGKVAPLKDTLCSQLMMESQ